MKDWKWIGICLLCGVLFSCSEDLGNYDYHELTEPEITGVEAKMSVLTFERLQLTPDLGSHDFRQNVTDLNGKQLQRTEVMR